MIAFQVDDMTCDHCVGAITKAVKALDAGAGVTIELARKLVTVDPAGVADEQVAQAIADAGFTPVAVETAAAPAADAPSCCGHCR